MSTKRTKEEQEAAEKLHKDKCCTTKWIAISIVLMFVGFILLISAVGLYNADDLDEYEDSDFQEDCYIIDFQERGSQCDTTSCANCWQPTYFLGTVYQPTCGAGSASKQGSDTCETFPNGCISVSSLGSCNDLSGEYTLYEKGEKIACYTYGETDNCNDAGRIDPDDEWGGQFLTYQILLAFAIILIIVGVIFFMIGAVRCLCKKVEDKNDVIDKKGTGCYACLDYDRCCYGESGGHATVVQDVDTKNPPQKKKRKKKKSMDGAGGGSSKNKEYNRQKTNDNDDDDNVNDEEYTLR